MPLVRLSIPALALQPVVAPDTAAQTWPAAVPVAIAGRVASHPSQMEKSLVARWRGVGKRNDNGLSLVAQLTF